MLMSLRSLIWPRRSVASLAFICAIQVSFSAQTQLPGASAEVGISDGKM
jgi:hypothetical protein